MTSQFRNDVPEVASILVDQLRLLGYRIAVRFTSYPDVDPRTLEVHIFGVPEDQDIEVESAAWDIVVSAERRHGFGHTILMVHGHDVREELEAALTASAIASWMPGVPDSPSLAEGR